MNSQINTIFNVCQHACCCMNCADELLIKNDPKCPCCRAKLMLPDNQPIYIRFYLNGIEESSEVNSTSESELKDKISKQSTQLLELQQQIQLLKSKSVEKSSESEIELDSEIHLSNRQPTISPTIRRRPLTAYNIFLRNYFETHRSATTSNINLMREASNEWKYMSQSEKDIWHSRALLARNLPN